MKVDLVRDVQWALDNMPVRGYSRRRVERMTEIVRKAKLGYYTDFNSPLAAPKTALHTDLLAVGLHEIDERMRNGNYDNDQ